MGLAFTFQLKYDDSRTLQQSWLRRDIKSIKVNATVTISDMTSCIIVHALNTF